MTESEAIALAKRVAKQNRWTWAGEGYARRSLPAALAHGCLGRAWLVRSHRGKGALVEVVIEDSTGRILAKRHEPR